MVTSIYVYTYGNDNWADAIDKSSLAWRFPEHLLSTATPLLRGVDVYDDTTFNQLQCGHLHDEVRYLLSLDLGSADKVQIEELGRLVEVVVHGKPHTYLRFSGD